MKKIICMALAAALMLGLCACGGNDDSSSAFKIPEVEGFNIGYAREDVTPENGTPMGGYGHPLTKLSTGASHPLYMICIAMSDGEDTVLLYSLDLGSCGQLFTSEAEQAVSEATGIPQERIIFCATHSHSAPDLGVRDQNEQAAKAFAQWKQAAVNTAKAALLDMAPATIQGGKTETEKLAFVRHYRMYDDTVAGDNFGSWDNLPKEYALESDEELVVTKFLREDKNDIMLLNFQLHPCFTAGDTLTTISSDCIGVTREYIQEKTGMDVIYFTGAAGNQNMSSKLVADVTNDTIDTWAAKLGEYAINTPLTDISGDDLKITSNIYTGQIWKEDDPDRLAKAKEVYKLFTETDRNTATPLAKEYGLASVYEAREIINHAENLGDTDTVEMNAFSVGGFGFVTAPYEMFSLQGSKIKDESPFAVTAVMGYAGIHKGYIPSEEAYDYGCYESQTALFVKGTAEILADKYLEMLKSIQ